MCIYRVFHNYQVQILFLLFPTPYSLLPTPCSLLHFFHNKFQSKPV
ncbi:hypothetical protein [Moorena producens]